LKGMQAFSLPRTIDDTPAGGHCMSHCCAIRFFSFSSPPLGGEGG
jgi:hypothetical protein